MLDLHTIYKPITADPFRRNNAYVEIVPCHALAPYVRCFWGTPGLYEKQEPDTSSITLVTPDTCMDIIFDIDYTNQQVANKFCGINDSSFCTSAQNGKIVKPRFAVRFYAWAVFLFSDDSMISVKNVFCNAEQYFSELKQAVDERLLKTGNIYQRAVIVQEYLLKKIKPDRQNANVMNAVHKILKHNGSIKTAVLSEATNLSIRQTERLFKEYIGLSPKKFSDLVRYQCLWQDIVYQKQFDVQCAVLRYGYQDQAHLLNDFKKYHTLTPMQAKSNVLQACRIFTRQI